MSAHHTTVFFWNLALVAILAAASWGLVILAWHGLTILFGGAA
jgi:hypothetical protein